MHKSPAIRKLAGKVAVVTASTEGIGLGIARRLGMDGAKVVVCSRRQQNVDRAVAKMEADNIDVFGQVCHVGNPDHRHRLIKETVKRNGGIDILVSNAAANPHIGPILECTESKWDKVFDVNLKSPFLLSKEVVPHMKERGGGSIVLVSSILGYVPYIPEILPYSVSKTALLALVKALAPECATMNIRVNGLVPGLVETNFSAILKSNPNVPQIPVGRVGKPEDCSGVVSFLVSDDAEYITGENIVVSGGMYSRL